MTARPPKPHSRYGKVILLFVSFCCVVAIPAFVLSNAQNIVDWWRLRNYTPSGRIISLADQTTMSSTAQRLFYVNKPQLLTGSSFSSNCTIDAEKTVVLGCYLSGDRGIYLYDVSNERLRGVVETTAAHEMLHAAYARLSDKEKQRIDRMLDNFYRHGLRDDRVRQTIDAYRQSEPYELRNEMHSIFATEVVTLPPGLESYYKSYFDNRGTVVAMAARYQAEFTSRRNQAAAYDAQLAALKKEIDANQATSTVRLQALNRDNTRMQALQRAGETTAYNRLVDTYNASVQSYNALLVTLRSQIEAYNQIVEKRNAIALEERALAQALTNQAIEQ